jgi:Spy/CpxP family protein refolding chaperone
MKSNRWPWLAALALVVALGTAIAMPHTRALAQPAPAPPQTPEQMGPADLGDDDPGDLAWLGGDDGPGDDWMEAPHDQPGGGWGRGPDGMGPPGLRRGMGGMRGGGMGMAFRQLDLTDDQQKKMADIRDRQQRTAIRARADLSIAELDLRKLMRADAPDRRAIESQIEKIGSMRTSMQKSRVGMMFDMRAVLTQEQRDQLKQMRMNGGPSQDKHSRSESD